MSKKAAIKLTLVNKKGAAACHHNHRVGDVFDFDTERGKLCPMFMHTAFPYIDILRYGGNITLRPNVTDLLICCPDAEVINIFKIEKQ